MAWSASRIFTLLEKTPSCWTGVISIRELDIVRQACVIDLLLSCLVRENMFISSYFLGSPESSERRTPLL